MNSPYCLVFALVLLQLCLPLLSFPGNASSTTATGTIYFLPSAYRLLQSSQAKQPDRSEKTPRVPVFVIDINQASSEDFEKLPGIGPKLAQQIVAYRQKHGPFRRVEELMVIKGIGVKKWKALRPHVRVGCSDTEKAR